MHPQIATLMNSIKHLRKKYYQSYTNSRQQTGHGWRKNYELEDISTGTSQTEMQREKRIGKKKERKRGRESEVEKNISK